MTTKETIDNFIEQIKNNKKINPEKEICGKCNVNLDIKIPKEQNIITPKKKIWKSSFFSIK